MTKFRRVARIVGLTLLTLITAAAAGWGGKWFRQAFRELPHVRQLEDALEKSVLLGLWLLPLIFIPRLRDIGSLRLRWSSTVLLLLPPIALNLSFFGPPGPQQAWILYIYWVWGAMATGAFEELVFRGYAFREDPEADPHTVVLVSATCFGLLHLANLTHDSLVNVLWNLPFHFVLGLALSIIRLASGSLAWCMLLHALLNTSADFAVKDDDGIQTFFPLGFLVMMIASIYTLCFHPKLRGRPALSSALPDAQVG